MPEAHDQPDDHDIFYDAPEPDAPPRARGGAGGGAGSAADVLMSALLDAGPETAEHLLKAAQELLLAAKAVVDAGERLVEQTRNAVADDDHPNDESQGDADQPRIRRIDLA
jgi:hypothetical protein